MKIVLVSVGTRGDMEPFVAIGEFLKAKGHQVICAFPAQFEPLATQAGLEFGSLGEKFIELLDSDAGKAAMGGASGWKKFVGIMKLAINQTEANKEVLIKQREIIDQFEPDCILYNGKSVYPILWHLKTKGKAIFISPLPYMHYVKGNTHIAFNSNYGEFLNKATFGLARFGLIMTIRTGAKWLKLKEKFKWSEIKNVIMKGESIYTISPTLFPRPEEWPEDLKVLGFHQKQQSSDWKPPKDLVDFVEKHEKILFITFGSMVNPFPEKNTQIILDILKRHQIPAIINTASGGLVRPDNFKDENIHFVSQIPYDWVFPKVYGVVHHGGSGTTHLGLKYGCASMIIPHIIDQFAWNRIISSLGVGPKGVKISKINVQNLEPKIFDLMNESKYKQKAEEIGQKMRDEDFKKELYAAIAGG